MRVVRRGLIAAVLAGALVGASACGDDDSGSGSGSGSFPRLVNPTVVFTEVQDGRLHQATGSSTRSPSYNRLRAADMENLDAVAAAQLDAVAAAQLDAARSASSGRSARTVHGGPGRALGHTVLALTAGSALAEHDNPGEATLLVLSGRVRLSTSESSWEGERGDLLVIPDARHRLDALTDAAVMLTVVKRP